MRNLLFLVHRLPYPPNKGDKVRSFNLLKHLTSRHRVFLGTFVDDPDDVPHIEAVRAICPDLHVARLHPRAAKVRSLTGLITHEALGLSYYQNAELQAWVKQTLAQNKMDAVVVFSSVMAQYFTLAPGDKSIPMLVDFVDVDSAKWTQYADNHRWPLSWLYRREGRQLLAYERSVAARAKHSFFVTENEVALFLAQAPECAGKVASLSNGVDGEYFSPDATRASPFDCKDAQSGEIPLVFTGAMDYWPNIDAVSWFANDIFPTLLKAWPKLRFYIVGRSPTAVVLALASKSIVVTGTVPDVRPYLQHATVVVAPLRVARGIQNKILEAMAMGRPVVASQSCAQAIDGQIGEGLVPAADDAQFVSEIDALLKSPDRAFSLGQAGRKRVLANYSWEAHLAGIDRYLGDKLPEQNDL